MGNKILIVEDDLPILKILVDKFTKEGYVVMQALDGLEGLEKIQKEKPDLVLLDIMMPKMDGITMLKNMRKEEWGKDVSVIILTNLADAKKVEEALSQGVYDFLIKTDWHLSDVVKKVKDTLHK